jgi:hypothetical protein
MMRIKRMTIAALGAVLAIGIVVAPASAAEPPPGVGPHSGSTGLHWILDNPGPDPEIPAVTCLYGGSSSSLKLFRVRQPVLLANTSAGFNRQKVGWKAVVESADDPAGPWTAETSTGWTNATAVAPFPVDLAPKEVAPPSGPLTGNVYRVTYVLRWYRANGTVDGTARHSATWFRATGPFPAFKIADGCSPAVMVVASANRPAGPLLPDSVLAHSGKRGAHWILDSPPPSPEFSAATCRYDTSDALVSIGVRRPMILARDTGPGTQAQDVAWRAVLEASQTNTGTEVFGDVIARSPWSRVRATELSWAKVQPRSFAIGALPEYQIVRVVYELRWFKGSTNQIVGRAKHTPVTYEGILSDDSVIWMTGHCYLRAPK